MGRAGSAWRWGSPAPTTAPISGATGVWLEEGPRPLARRAVARGPRVGIDYAGEWAGRPWRFWVRGNPWVSRGGR